MPQMHAGKELTVATRSPGPSPMQLRQTAYDNRLYLEVAVRLTQVGTHFAACLGAAYEPPEHD